ncbi:bola-like protein [Trichoderma cornu-damae]|uniref:Bola-like protein n=1 Tax=Trichoderma cornu-damae TaxID=654480 RepID=A0A9P8QKT8_9HYPO|nr:bola-like protein [Trichoderma cornu-damae]
MICFSCRSALRLRLLASLPRPSPTAIAPIATSSSETTARASQRIPFLSSSASRQFSSSSPRRFPSTPSSSPQEQDQDQDTDTDMSPAESSIAALLSSKLNPTSLLVQDISGGCGSMYAIDITSPAFRGLNMLKQQRLVNAALGDLVKEWHGVQIRTRVPPEDESK